MSTKIVFSNEVLNFSKFASIALNEIPKAMRNVFVNMWNTRIASVSSNQCWDDSTAVRNILHNRECLNTKIPPSSPFEDWDCTVLFRVTLYARTFALPDSMGNIKTLSDLYVRNRKPNPFHLTILSPTGDPHETIALAIDQLRLLRNKMCHFSNNRLTKIKFDDYVNHVKEAFGALAVSTTSIEAIGNLSESDFPTELVERLEERCKEARYTLTLTVTLEINGQHIVAGSAMALAAYYLHTPENKRKVVTLLCGALEGMGKMIERITFGCLVVELRCYSQKCFLEFFDDYKLDNVKNRLSRELSRIGIGEVTVEIDNKEDVIKQIDVIRVEMSKASAKISETEEARVKACKGGELSRIGIEEVTVGIDNKEDVKKQVDVISEKIGKAPAKTSEEAPGKGEKPPNDAPELQPNENRRYTADPLAVLIAVVLVLFLLIFSPQKPVVEIKTEKHVSPMASSWQLQGSCRGYNLNCIITKCHWKQIHPKPTNPANTLFTDGTKDCLHGNPAHKINATLRDLRIPVELGNYILELHCTDQNGYTNDERVGIWIKTLTPPQIKVVKKIQVLTSVGLIQLYASCQAVQGKVVNETWEFIDGPKDLDHPTRDGIIDEIDVPGKYEFKFKCLDSYDGHSSTKVNVIAKPPFVIGIDLGTSTTCIVVIKEDGTSQDINIFHGDGDIDPCMPSVVAFAKNGKLLIGEEALHQAVTNPLATIYEVKRLMGRSYYDDPNHKFSYKVRPTLASYSLKGVRAAIEIPCDGEDKLLQPELVSALILHRAADVAEKYLQAPVKHVVISVPAQFDDAQRKATIDAGRIAGLNPIKIVNEPTVAAFEAKHVMEYWLNSDPQDPGIKKQQNTVWVVVADIGGGTTDYALMQIEKNHSKNHYKVITTDGNKILGGRDIDIALAKKLTEILQEEHSNLNLNSIEFQQRLRIECEFAKVVLSDNNEYYMTVAYSDEKHEKLLLWHSLTRDAFENYISEILKEMVAPLDSLLKRAKGMSRNNIEELYLVGGTSNIPKLKEMLQNYFGNLKEVLHKDPVQLVSRGAAAFGAALTHLVEVQNMPEIDVTPLPISIAVDMNDMYEIFPRNSVYPTFSMKKVTTFTNEQTSIVVKVYEGEGCTANENHFLGELELSGIPPQPKGIPKIETTYTINANGILSVTAAHAGKGTRKNLDVYTKSGSMMKKTKEKLSSLSGRLLKSDDLSKCSLLETAAEMKSILPKPEKGNVLKLYVDSEFDNVETSSKQNQNAIGMITIKSLVTNSEIETTKTDMDIVLVIDKSGSMVGIPMGNLQNAILGLVNVLNANNRLGIVTYDGFADTRLDLTYCTDENKKTARAIVRDIEASGISNLYDGLVRGLEMAYHGGRSSRVLLFTDGMADVGLTLTEDIIGNISRTKDELKLFTSAEVQLYTFGYLGNHDEVLLSRLASNGGTYNYLDENTKLAERFGLFMGDAINTIAERIQLTVTPLNGVQIMKVTGKICKKDEEKMTCEIPSLADQHSLHILLELSVPPCEKEKAHDVLFHVDLKYTNTITNRVEGSEERLFVARTPELEKETRSREVDEQLNRVFVTNQIGKSLDHLNKNNKEQTTRMLKEADEFIMASISKDSTLSLCLHRDLYELISLVKYGDLSDAKKALQDSLMSYLQEKGGRSTCYLTKKQVKLITILEN